MASVVNQLEHIMVHTLYVVFLGVVAFRSKVVLKFGGMVVVLDDCVVVAVNYTKYQSIRYDL